MTRSSAAPLVFATLVGGSVCAASLVQAQSNDVPVPPTHTVIQQEQFQTEKSALTDEAHRSIGTAEANIGALKDKAKSAAEPEKTQYTDLADKLSVLKGHVSTDIDKMGNASANDWDGLHPVVQRDLSALNAELKRASTITHIPAPKQ
jgi:hypothetical protein